jgi:hypothetical protein
MNPLELPGTLLKELSLRKDKNDHDYYLGKLICDNGSQKAFFFFRPGYDLSMRLVDLKVAQKITLKGCWGKNSVAFIASDFYLEKQENVFGMKEDNERFGF